MKGVDLGISQLPIDTGSKVINNKSVGSLEARQFGTHGKGDGVGGVEVPDQELEKPKPPWHMVPRGSDIPAQMRKIL